MAHRKISAKDSAELLATLSDRFEEFPQRHREISWSEVSERLRDRPEKMASLSQMESTGGEPDVVGRDSVTGEILFFDCSAETPKGRTSVCYDREGWNSRKEHRPADTAIDMANAMGIAILTEEQYLQLQTLGEFDSKTSSWLETPASIRKLGGALHGDRRYGRVFVGYNGAQSYYAARAFRGSLRV